MLPQPSLPPVRDLVLIGGGHSHVYVLKAIGMKPIPGVQVTLIAKDIDTPYSGMLPGHIAGHYTREQCHIDLGKLARFAGARLIHASATGLDRTAKLVQCDDGRPPLRYDVCSIDVGSTPQLLPGAAARAHAHVTPVKPINGLSRRWEAILARITAAAADGAAADADAAAADAESKDAGEHGGGSGGGGGARRGAMRVVVVGGGAGGVELALSMQHRLRREARAAGAGEGSVAVALVSRAAAPLPGSDAAAQRLFARILEERGIETHFGSGVVDVVAARAGGGGGGGGSGGGSSGSNGADGPDGESASAGSAAAGEGESATAGGGGGKSGGGGGGSALLLESGAAVPFDEAIWCTNSGAAPWLARTGLALSADGFIAVRPTLQSACDDSVFAAGDCAHMAASPRPKAGVFAVRQGPPLARNLRAALEGALPRRLEAYAPQRDFLSIIGLGDEDAVVVRGAIAWRGAWAWAWKRHIDVTWMRGFQELPGMSDAAAAAAAAAPPPAYVAAGRAAVATLSEASMRCGGCGSKVGPGVLREVLRGLRAAAAPAPAPGSSSSGGSGGGEGALDSTGGGGSADGDSSGGGGGGSGGSGGGAILVGLDAPDDAAVVLPPTRAGAALVHTVDFFRAHVSDPYAFGRVAANHALSDAHAMGAAPATALAIAVVPHCGEAQAVALLTQMMAGALRALREAGCELVGGHTSEGAELALGFAVNAVVQRDEILRKGGMRAGDALILTKPLGTGAVLAADMRGRAAGAWTAAALDGMLRSNAAAAAALRAHGATAATDVTGFGLAGHLLEMVRATNADKTAAAEPVAARLRLDAVPLLPGAAQCAAAGTTSSLYPANVRAAAGAVTPALSVAEAAAAAAAAAALRGDGGSAHSIPRGGSGGAANGSSKKGSGAGSSGGAVAQARAAATAAHALLFDPQTAGGLLAAVPAERAAACVAALRGAGYAHAARIGTAVAAGADGDSDEEVQCTWGEEEEGGDSSKGDDAS